MSKFDDLLKCTEDEREHIESTLDVSTILKEIELVNSAKSTLNEDQTNAFDGIIEFLSNPKKELATIVGYAGTGKTYLISKIVSAVQGKVAMTAPTNKAVKVLSDNRSPDLSGVSYATIHKLLALTLKRVFPKQGKPYQVLSQMWRKEPTVNEYSILIIDEASMLDDELFHMLIKIKQKKLKIIFLGDGAQIPPVGKPDTIPLIKSEQEKYNISVFTLDRIMRQKEGSGILKTAGSIRDKRFLHSTDVIQERVNTNDVVFVQRYNEQQTQFMLNKMQELFTSDEFDKDPNYCKLIAWRNDTVNGFNDVIRKFIYKTNRLDYVMPGEKLIADTPVIVNNNIVFNTSDEFTVISYIEKVFTYIRPDNKEEREERDNLLWDDKDDSIIDLKKKQFIMPYLETIVDYCGAKSKIDILLPAGFEPLKWAISDVFKHKLNEEYGFLSDRFAKVKYNYAITAHKSQGSTYKNVFIIEDDMDKNPNIVERNRIKYTAVSRASENLFIVSKRN